MLSKIGAILVLTTTMLGGCAVWTHTPARDVGYDYSDRAFYDRSFAPSPTYADNFVQNVGVAPSPADDQAAPALAKTAPDQKPEQRAEGGVDADPIAIVVAPVEAAPPPPRYSSQGVEPRQSTSPGPVSGGRSSSDVR